MSARGKTLSDEDRILWNLVARSARPLRGKALPAGALPPPPAESPASAPAQGVAASAPAPAPKRQHVAHVLDRPTLDRLGKGKLPIEGRVDLHGMTQSEAHELLFSFLRRAHAGGVRYVLVITGKGSSSGGEGVLRRAVPAWLGTPAFRPLVSSYDHAAMKHGGSGALYVRLRRSS
jgi:DNA-nicking Smr family endonuclease